MELIQPIIFYNEEIWRPITTKSVPDIVDDTSYLISSYGRVFSNLRNRLMALTPTWNGYLRVCLRKSNGTSRYFLVHRIMMIEFNPIDNYQNMTVNHLDTNRANNHLWNLEWTDQSNNIKYAYQLGTKRQYHGEDCSFATINNAQADKIGEMIATQQYTHQQISDILGIPKHIVHNIACGSTWIDVYNKYQLWKYKKPVNKITDEKLHEMCRYIMNHLSEFHDPNLPKSIFFRKMLSELYNEEFTNNMSGTYSRIFTTKQTRRDITSQYDF